MAPGDYFRRHVRACKRGLVYKVSFATFAGKPFCYFGCGKYDDRRTLVKHLMADHANHLWVWGLSRDFLLPSLERKTLTRECDSHGGDALGPISFIPKSDQNQAPT